MGLKRHDIKYRAEGRKTGQTANQSGALLVHATLSTNVVDKTFFKYFSSSRCKMNTRTRVGSRPSLQQEKWKAILEDG